MLWRADGCACSPFNIPGRPDQAYRHSGCVRERQARRSDDPLALCHFPCACCVLRVACRLMRPSSTSTTLNERIYTTCSSICLCVCMFWIGGWVGGQCAGGRGGATGLGPVMCSVGSSPSFRLKRPLSMHSHSRSRRGSSGVIGASQANAPTQVRCTEHPNTLPRTIHYTHIHARALHALLSFVCVCECVRACVYTDAYERVRVCMCLGLQSATSQLSVIRSV